MTSVKSMGSRYAALAAALIVLAGCGSGASPTTNGGSASSSSAPSSSSSSTKPSAAQHLQKVTLLTSWLPSGNQLPFFYGVAHGYYKAVGLDVTIEDGKGTAVTVQQVGNGKAQFGWASLDVMALSEAKGVPVEAVMGGFQKQVFGVFVPKGSDIRSLKDLVGHSVIVTAGSPETFYLPADAKILHFDIHKVKLIDVSAADKVADYIDGKGDAMATDAPYADPSIQPTRPSRILYFADSGLVSPSYGLFVKRDYLKADAGVIRRFVAASVKSWKAVLNSPAAARAGVQDMIAARPQAKINAAEMVASWNLYRPFVNTARTKGHPFGWESSADWTQALTMLHRYAGLNGSLNPSDYFTNTYLPK